MENYDFWAVVKDQGGVNAVLPVVRWLRQTGYRVLLIANGEVKNILADQDSHIACETAGDALHHPLPKALLTSMCSNGGVGRNLVPLLRTLGIHTVAIQDHWGSRLWTDWADTYFRPDHIIVNDEHGANLVLEAWPEYAPERVLQLGYPALDQFAKFDAGRSGAIVKQMLGIHYSHPVVLFSGQLKGTGRTLATLADSLGSIGKNVYLVTRQHPRVKTDAPLCEDALWYAAIRGLRHNVINIDCPASILPNGPFGLAMRGILAASDLVISMFSSTLVEAACLRKPCISILLDGKGGGMEAFLEESQGGRREVPVVKLGCCKQAWTQEELCGLLCQFFETGDLELKARQEEVFQLDGKNAERVGNFLLQLLN